MKMGGPNGPKKYIGGGKWAPDRFFRFSIFSKFRKMKNRYNTSFGWICEYAVGTVKLTIKSCIYSYFKISYLVKNQKNILLEYLLFVFLQQKQLGFFRKICGDQSLVVPIIITSCYIFFKSRRNTFRSHIRAESILLMWKKIQQPNGIKQTCNHDFVSKNRFFMTKSRFQVSQFLFVVLGVILDLICRF